MARAHKERPSAAFTGWKGFSGRSWAKGAVVVRVSVTSVALAPEPTAVSESEQLARAGSSAGQVREMSLVNPFCGVTVRVKVADCPGRTVTLGGEAETMKFGSPIGLPLKLGRRMNKPC